MIIQKIEEVIGGFKNYKSVNLATDFMNKLQELVEEKVDELGFTLKSRPSQPQVVK